VNADNLLTVPKSWVDTDPVGVLGPTKRRELDRAVRYALDIRF
jgi:hypothetical protein